MTTNTTRKRTNTTAIGARKRGSFKPEQRPKSRRAPRTVAEKRTKRMTLKTTQKSQRNMNAPYAKKTSTATGGARKDGTNAITDENDSDSEALATEEPPEAT
ncbi:hypothetical protein HPB52_019313 [Rhipicephalus sanguineus]|uniref:Uncharacterized protein n=1 Tax=Rhipicephalus sanguineus TaxID=34632 RepID=A0A9D4QA80_RHISA|nr:hypothetical protein HPB52_019313 [Rhipicephalus sanguineus]